MEQAQAAGSPRGSLCRHHLGRLVEAVVGVSQATGSPRGTLHQGLELYLAVVGVRCKETQEQTLPGLP